MKTILFAWISIVCCGCTPREEIDQQLQTSVERYFDVLVKNKDFSGVVLVANHDRILASYVGGYSDQSKKELHIPESRFSVASITKTFTSAAILNLQREGRLELRDKVKKYLPEFPHGEKISVLNLLRHESGLSEIDEREFQSTRLTSDELIAEIGKLPLRFEPGEDGEYSNSGFSLLAKIVERASGMTFEHYLHSAFFDRLGIRNTGDEGGLETVPSISKPYFPGPPPELLSEIENINPSLSFGSGSIYSTASDLWTWGKAISQRKIIDIFAEKYPYGWGRDSLNGRFVLNQTGMHDGYVSSLFVFPDHEIIVVLLSNVENGLWVDWTKDVARMVFDDDSSLLFPSERKLAEVSSNTLSAKTVSGTYRLNEQRFVEIRQHNGNLYLHLNGYYRGHYLTPVGVNTYELRSFTGTISFQGDEGSTMKWTMPAAWGGSSDEYVKQRN